MQRKFTFLAYGVIHIIYNLNIFPISFLCCLALPSQHYQTKLPTKNFFIKTQMNINKK